MCLKETSVIVDGLEKVKRLLKAIVGPSSKRVIS